MGRPLDDVERVVRQAPFDVLGAAEVRFDLPADALEPHHLLVRQHSAVLPLGLVDDLAVADLVGVGVHQAGDQGLSQAEGGVDGRHLPAGRDGIGREQDPRRLREDHLLDDHGELDLTMIEAVLEAVGHGPLGEERGPALADALQDRRLPDDVQVRLVLAREGGRRQILRRRAGADREGPRSPPNLERKRLISSWMSPGMVTPSMALRISPLSALIWSRSPASSRSSSPPSDDVSSTIRLKASVEMQKPSGTRIPSILESSPRFAPLPPTTEVFVWSTS